MRALIPESPSHEPTYKSCRASQENSERPKSHRCIISLRVTAFSSLQTRPGLNPRTRQGGKVTTTTSRSSAPVRADSVRLAGGQRSLLVWARDQGDVWFIQKPTRNDLHPTMKPVELVERALRKSSKSRDTVLDAFGGSGSTLIACEKTGRHARLIELEPRYVDATITRWEQYVNRKATLDGSGQATNRSGGSG